MNNGSHTNLLLSSESKIYKPTAESAIKTPLNRFRCPQYDRIIHTAQVEILLGK